MSVIEFIAIFITFHTIILSLIHKAATDFIYSLVKQHQSITGFITLVHDTSPVENRIKTLTTSSPNIYRKAIKIRISTYYYIAIFVTIFTTVSTPRHRITITSRSVVHCLTSTAT